MQLSTHYWGLFFGLFLFFANLIAVQGQSYQFLGRVTDDDTDEGIPFANVFLEGKIPYGTTTDVDGYFSFKIPAADVLTDSLTATSVGYNRMRKPVQKGNFAEQTINFRLKSGSYALTEVEVLAGENPANEIVRNIIKNKYRNNRKNFDNYETEVYSKTELDLDNIDPEMKDKKIFKQVQFIFDNIDSVSDVKPFLPAYVAERIYNVYYLKKAAAEKEILKAQNVSGINNESVVEQINRMHDKYNIYDNLITMLGKEFLSPFSNQALSNYEFYILDSTHIHGQWSYKIKYKPKRKQENTFFGDFWVSMENYGLEIVNMRMSPEVNVNLVNRIILYQEFKWQDSLWVPYKEKTVIDFSTGKKEKQAGIIGRKTLMYKGFIANLPSIELEFKTKDPESVDPRTLVKPDSFWQENRHEQLSKNEEAVYKMIDSVKQVPMYRTVSNILYTLGGGYQMLGPIEFGPYWDILNTNNVEGYRFGMGVGTSYKFSKKLWLYGYGAYGTFDKSWKYRGLFEYVFDNYRRKEMGVQVRDDVSFEYKSTEEQSSQGLFAGFIRRKVPPKIMRTFEAKAFYHHTWKRGWSNHLAFVYRKMNPYNDSSTISGQGFNYRYLPDPLDDSKINTNATTAEILFRTRYAYKERLVKNNFSDLSLGSEYPIVELSYTAGIKGILGSEHNYHRIVLDLSHWFYVGAAGWLSYNLEFGKVLGNRVPYLFLQVHPGNEAYFYNKNAYNMMNSYEFVSDQYIGLKLEHHLDGFFLNRIPLIRKLKWREIAFFRGVWGTLSAQNEAANILSHQFNGGPFYGRLDKGPYMEAGFGIENIFKFIRVDCLWRLNYWENPNIQKFSVRATLNFNF